MKTLLLLRHAKSSWADPGQPDFERPLNERGRQTAPVIGRFLVQRMLKPDTVVCSPAERARETAALVLAAAELSPAVRYDARIYEASAPRLLEEPFDTGLGRRNSHRRHRREPRRRGTCGP